jgi:hypothetical protein
MTIISARMTAKLAQIRRRIVQSFMVSITFAATRTPARQTSLDDHCTLSPKGRLYPMEQNSDSARCAQSHSRSTAGGA